MSQPYWPTFTSVCGFMHDCTKLFYKCMYIWYKTMSCRHGQWLVLFEDSMQRIRRLDKTRGHLKTTEAVFAVSGRVYGARGWGEGSQHEEHESKTNKKKGCAGIRAEKTFKSKVKWEKQQIGSGCPGHQASTPKQLLTLFQSSDRLAGALTTCHGWPRLLFMFTPSPAPENWICISGRQWFPVCVCVRGVCNVFDQTPSPLPQ